MRMMCREDMGGEREKEQQARKMFVIVSNVLSICYKLIDDTLLS